VFHAFPVLALSVALSAPAEAPLLGRILNLPPANPGFFRAAMVVNLTIRPLFPAGSVPTGPSNSALPASSVPTEPSGHEPPAGSVPTGPSDRALPASSVPAEPSDHDPPANSVSVAVAENYSFEWHMGKPRWLPSLRNSRRRGGV
jgi:hypothetical protein